MNLIVFVFLMCLASVSYAHPGHGGMSAFAHDVEHLLWYVAGGVLFLSLLILLKRKN